MRCRTWWASRMHGTASQRSSVLSRRPAPTSTCYIHWWSCCWSSYALNCEFVWMSWKSARIYPALCEGVKELSKGDRPLVFFLKNWNANCGLLFPQRWQCWDILLFVVSPHATDVALREWICFQITESMHKAIFPPPFSSWTPVVFFLKFRCQ